MKSCSVVKFFVSAWAQPGYGSMLITTLYLPRPFGKPSCGPGLSSASLSLPVVIITRLILSNLSFILANQLLRCALFFHLLSCDSIIYSYPPTPPPALTSYSLFFSIFISLCFPPVMASGSTLTRPSARAQTNQSRVVLFHKDQKQLVSSHVSCFLLVCLCCPICLPASSIPPSMNYCLFAWLVNHLRTVKVPHTWFQAWLQSTKIVLVLTFNVRISVIVSTDYL